MLAHERAGDRRQMQGLARALGWPATFKKLAFRPPNIPYLARFLLDRQKSDALEPPWPDLVLCAEARASVIARLVRQRSQGAVKTVCLGRPAGSPLGFDLVLTTAQYRLPKAPRVVELTLPIGAGAPAAPEQPGPADDGAGLSRPVTAVLIGGTSLPEQLDERAAAELARRLMDRADTTRGTLLVTTSPRTDAAAAAVLARAIPAPHVVHVWNGASGNPYRRFLALADDILVTSDSVSMLGDALATGKPVSIYPLPRRWTLRTRAVERLYELTWARAQPPSWLAPVRWLFDNGLIEVRPERRLLLDRLAAQGRVRWFGEVSTALPPSPVTDDTEIAVARIRELFASDAA